MGLDRVPSRLRPEQHVCVGAVVPFDREDTNDIGHCLSLSGKPREPFREAPTVHMRPSQVGSEQGVRVVELAPGHRLCSTSIVQAVRGIAG